MLQYISGNDRRYDVGEEVDLPDAQAERWIAAGFAAAITDGVAVDEVTEARDAEPVAVASDATAPEAATLDDAPEHATLQKARKRG